MLQETILKISHYPPKKRNLFSIKKKTSFYFRGRSWFVWRIL